MFGSLASMTLEAAHPRLDSKVHPRHRLLLSTEEGRIYGIGRYAPRGFLAVYLRRSTGVSSSQIMAASLATSRMSCQLASLKGYST